MAVGGAGEIRGARAHVRARDDATHGDLGAVDEGACVFADAVELVERNHILMRGDLQHRIARGVDDQVARGQLVLAVVLEHFGAGVGLVAHDVATAERAELVEQLIGEALREVIHLKARGQAHHFPVAVERVVAQADDAHAAKAAGGLGVCAYAGERLTGAHAAQAETLHVGERERAPLVVDPPLGHMAEGVGAV